MILFLRSLFVVILLSMLWVTIWAGNQCPLFAIPKSVSGHPWFIATLFDTYWAFTTFFIWVAYKETGFINRLLWFVSIMLLGNIAISSYCLRELFGLRIHSKLSDALLSRRTGTDFLGILLSAIGIAVVIFGLKGSTPTG